MPHTFRLDDLQGLSSWERERLIAQFSEEVLAPVNGQVEVIDARIRAFEERYEISSAALIERLRENSQAETADIAEWLFWLDLRARAHG